MAITRGFWRGTSDTEDWVPSVLEDWISGRQSGFDRFDDAQKWEILGTWARRRVEVRSDFECFVKGPASELLGRIEPGIAHLEANLAHDLETGWPGHDFIYPWQVGILGLPKLVWVAAGLSIDRQNTIFPIGEEKFGRESFVPYQALELLTFKLGCSFVREGKIAAFAERHGVFVKLPPEWFLGNLPKLKDGYQNLVFARVDLIREVAQAECNAGPGKAGPKAGAEWGRERKAEKIVSTLASTESLGRMTKNDFKAAMKEAGFSAKAGDRIWANAAPDHWKDGGRPRNDVPQIPIASLTAALVSLEN